MNASYHPIPAPPRKPPLESIAHHFTYFARQVGEGYSPLYERLALGCAADTEMLKLASQASPDQPIPPLLFAAVYHLLLKGEKHPLAGFYPLLKAEPPRTDDPYPLFRNFCRSRHLQIEAILRTRRVQTNEVSRCGSLLPAFGLIVRMTGGRPIAMIEVGASAGLNLLWDRYAYDFEAGGRYGVLDSPVQVRCALRGNLKPPFPPVFPTIAVRCGIDLNPIDVRDPEAARWLRALVWPELAERAEMLSRAMEMIQEEPPDMVAGDALEKLPSVAASVPDGLPICVFHSYTINQFSTSARERFREILQEIAQQRELYHVALEWQMGEDFATLSWETFREPQAAPVRLAACHHHGLWLEWLDPATAAPGAADSLD
jgi:hypothetical protein